MKNKIIRRGTFETNSSSCHSLCIGKDFPFSEVIPNAILPNEDGVSVINLIDYGYGYDSYGESDSLDKVLYYITTLVLKTNYPTEDELLPENLKDNTNWLILKELIMEVTEAKDVRLLTVEQEESIRSSNGYNSIDVYTVDHDSFDLLDEIEGETLYKYIGIYLMGKV